MKVKWLKRFVGLTLVAVSILHIQVPIARAQEPEQTSLRLEPVMRFSHLSADDGLVQNKVNAVVQDHLGFMWFGTDSGLSRYDGYHFLTFQHDPENPNSLSHNFVHDLYVGGDGMIWIGTAGGGINRLDVNTLTFTAYLPPPLEERVDGLDYLGDRHHTIFQDSRGYVWAGRPPGGGLDDFDPVTGTIAFYRANDIEVSGLGGDHVGAIIETEEQVLWMAARTAVARYDLKTERFTNYDLSDSGENDLRAIYEDSRGRIWAGGRRGLYKLDVDTDSFDLYPVAADINDILEIDNDLLWLATGRGLYRFDVQSEQIIGHDEPYSGIPDSLNNGLVEGLYRDRSGKIWLYGPNGMDIYDPSLARFDYFRHLVPGAPGSLVDGRIQSIYISDQNIAWIAVDSTLHKANLNTNAITLFRLEDYDLGTQRITALHQDHSGMLWLGTSEFQLLTFDPATERFDEYHSFPKPAQAPGDVSIILGLHEDGQNHLWVIMGFDGVYRLDETRETMTRFDPPMIEPPPDALPPPGPQGTEPPANAPPPPGSQRTDPPPNVPGPPGTQRPEIISGSYLDRAGTLWLTTINSLYHFDPTTETYLRFRLLAEDDEPVDTWTETCMEDREGIIWVAARDGLFRLDPATGEVKAYTTNDGLPTNRVIGIMQDEAGDLWISTKKGLSRFTPATEVFRNYDVFDGLQGNEFGDRLFAQASDGRMFLGGPNGLTAFYPEEIIDDIYQPPVVLSDFLLFNQSVQPGADSPLSEPIWLTHDLTLDHDQNILTFEFAALNYAFDDHNHYRYRLVGLETEWNEVDSNHRFATYTNLSAGDYTFQVQGTNSDDVWSENEVSLSLTVLPPWWETAWFRIAAGLSIIGIVLAGYQLRVRRIAHRNRELQEEVDRQTRSLLDYARELEAREKQLLTAKEASEAASRAKSTFLANMSHELRSPLNAILGFAQITKRNQTLPGDVYENLSVITQSGEHLLDLINQVLDLSKIEAGHITLNETSFDLYRMLVDLEDMFILAVSEKGLSLIIERADDVPQYLFADVTKLRQTLINLIGNALKFTTHGTITVRVTNASEENHVPSLRLQFEVEDTGSGIADEELPVLFDAFVQTATGRDAQEGTGLGLTISRRFVRLMGGDIEVKSEVGKGTTFTFDIACRVATTDEITATYQHQEIMGIAPDQPQYRIMVVDDKSTNRQFLIKLLAPLGFEMREAANGQEAIDIAKIFKPHLIWMDIRMPVMDGIEAIRHLKATPMGQTMKIIVLTASGYEEERVDVEAAGCDDYVRKPVQTDTVFEMLNKHIGVQYTYVEWQSSEALPSGMLPDELKAALSTLPAALVTRFRECLELGDMEVIGQTIAEIEKHHSALAQSLNRLAQQFQFAELLLLVRGEGQS